jgi:MoaA/NifB/PqqE/SkfB family radical SAM enzyme
MKLIKNTGQILQTVKKLYRKEVPGQLIIQLTDKCNAFCPQCGMRVTERFPRSKLPTDDVKRTLDSAAEKGVKVVSFTGGEPMLLFDELIELIKYAGKAGIEYIRTGTNGFMFANGSSTPNLNKINKIAEKLSNTPLRNFWISVDSAIPAVHENIRGIPGVIRGVEEAIPIFHSHGIYPSANLGINRAINGHLTECVSCSSLNQKDYCDDFYQVFRIAFKKFYQFVIDLGFTVVNCCYPMSVDQEDNKSGLKSVYAATSEENLVRFQTEEKALLFKALFDTIPEYRSKIRIFSPRTTLYALLQQYRDESKLPYPCRGGIDYFYIDSKDGNTYPCGYRGNENLGKFWDIDIPSLDRHAACHLCEWECFRDPSELFGPLLDTLNSPLDLIKRISRDRQYFKIWAEDLKYYGACDFFDGREPPDYQKLKIHQHPMKLSLGIQLKDTQFA